MKGVKQLMILLGNSDMSTEKFDYIRLLCEDKSKAVFLSSEVYEQAVIITHRFDGLINQIKKILDCDENHEEAVNWFYNNAPEPINILAPFLGLVNSDVEELYGPNREEVMYGFLHYMSNYIDFNEFLLVPDVVRKGISVSKLSITAYQKSWASLVYDVFGHTSKNVEVTHEQLTLFLEGLEKLANSFEHTASNLILELKELVNQDKNAGQTINVYAGGSGGTTNSSHGSFPIMQTDGEDSKEETIEDVAAYFDSIVEDMDWGDANFDTVKVESEEEEIEQIEESTVEEVKSDPIGDLANLFG